jgi:hypothetical protein
MPKAANTAGVRDGWEDGHVRELLEWLIPLTMNDLLVAANNLHALLNDIQSPIRAATHGEDTLEHLQHPGALRRGRGGTTAAGGAWGSHNRRRRGSVMSPQILRHCGTEWLMLDILVELLMCHHLNHELNI